MSWLTDMSPGLPNNPATPGMRDTQATLGALNSSGYDRAAAQKEADIARGGAAIQSLYPQTPAPAGVGSMMTGALGALGTGLGALQSYAGRSNPAPSSSPPMLGEQSTLRGLVTGRTLARARDASYGMEPATTSQTSYSGAQPSYPSAPPAPQMQTASQQLKGMGGVNMGNGQRYMGLGGSSPTGGYQQPNRTLSGAQTPVDPESRLY